MRTRELASIALALSLGGCAWIEEQREAARRKEAETTFVNGVGAGGIDNVRRALDSDRTFVNAVRWVPGDGSSSRAETALTMAVKKGQREMVDLLLELGANPNQVDYTGASPLAAAIYGEKDQAAYVALLLAKGADPALAFGGTTALHAVAGSTTKENEEVLRLLLAKGSGVGLRDARGQTPLHAAAWSPNLTGLRLLLAKGADPNAGTLRPRQEAASPDDVAGTTALAIVARDRQIAAAATLCALGADPEIRDSRGATARQVAARIVEREAVGADPTNSDVLRRRNMAAFLAPGGGCDAFVARARRGETVVEAEVARIANESECETGWGWACGQAGWAFNTGEGAKLDEKRALTLFRKGCETPITRNEWSCGMVGIYHVEGTAVPKDPAEGARWLAMGCERDPKRSDAQSCGRLGTLYAEGRGVPKDLGRAQALFKKACADGYKEACEHLAKYGGTSQPGRS